MAHPHDEEKIYQKKALDKNAGRVYNERDISETVSQISRNLKAAGLGLIRLSEQIKLPPREAAQAEGPHLPNDSDE